MSESTTESGKGSSVGAVFSSRWAMMLVMLGMAVGTGNIWRFPRIVAKNGGGEFLIAWVVFLFLWSIPLILLEFGMGRKTRSGPIKAFIIMMGPRWAWMGAFCVFVTSAITFYYTVVAGWTLRYTIASLTGEIPEATPGAFWESFTNSYWPVLTHGIMITLAVWVVVKGVGRIEKIVRILMPTLLVLIVILTIRALTLPGAGAGLSYMFSVDWGNLLNAKIWIEALTQNAWDTGAGWGLVLCYAAYMREKEDTALNGFILPTANNVVSLMAGIMVFCTVFSVVPQLIEQAQTDPSVLSGLGKLDDAVKGGATFSEDLMQETIFSDGNAGITFVWMPQLFKTLGFGRVFMLLFFMTLSFAAFTSLIAQVEVMVRAFVDAGVNRVKAIKIVGIATFVLGVPSAISMNVLNNQDWVWGVALMLAGLFFCISVIPYGVKKFREEQLNHEDSNIRIGVWWDIVIKFLAPVQMAFLLVWFMIQSYKENPVGWLAFYDKDNISNVGAVVWQFVIVLVVLIALNKWIVKKTLNDDGTLTDGEGNNDK